MKVYVCELLWSPPPYKTKQKLLSIEGLLIIFIQGLGQCQGKRRKLKSDDAL